MNGGNAEQEPAETQPVEQLLTKPRGSLFRKYTLLIAALVSGVLTAGGLIEIYFSYQETKSALFQIQHGKAAATAVIDRFVKEVEVQMGWTMHVALSRADSLKSGSHYRIPFLFCDVIRFVFSDEGVFHEQGVFRGFASTDC